MSGICAVVHFDGRPADPHTASRVASAAAFRGPDGIRTWHDGPACLIHLANHITPEDARERQPLVQGSLVLVSDARIDNREDLLPLLRAKRLIADGAATDADVILAAHRYWGHEAPAQLIGDFAYALYDAATRELFAARDPLGMRVVHYHATDRLLVLATEIEQILAHPDVPVALFEPMVAAHLAGPYGRDGWTFYAGIHELAPGHALHATPRGRRTWRSWSIDPEQRIRYRTEAEYADHLRDLLRRSVTDRSRTTKPIGIMLSGGLDSGGAASMLGHTRGSREGSPVHAYSWAFHDATLAQGDERRVSGQVVSRFGFVGRDVVADELWPLQGYPEHGPDRNAPYVLVYQPAFDWAFAMAAEDRIGTLWVGDRGDEMLGDWVFDHPGMLRSGRWWSLAHELRAHANWGNRSLRSVLVRDLWQPLLQDLGWRRQSDPAKGRIPRRLPPYVREDWARQVGLFDTITVRRSDTPRLSAARRARLERVLFFRGIRDPGLHERRAARQRLTIVDPFSDARLARFVMAIPGWVIQRPSEPKRLLRRALRGVMPDEVLQSSRKTEPARLFERGFRDRGRATMLHLLTDMQLASRGFVDEGALRAAYATYLAGGPVRHDIWWPVTLEMWLRRYWN